MAVKTSAQVLCWNSSSNHDTGVPALTEQAQCPPITQSYDEMSDK